MTRFMYDGITVSELPAVGAQLVAGYTDGNWPSYAAMVTRFPALTHVSVTVHATDNVGIVLDVEAGDATPEQAVNWVLTRRAAGADPTVYCSVSAWPSVQASFDTHDVAQPHYWVAHYDGVVSIPAGAVAKQYADYAGYDVSIVADYWPGVDPAPTTQGADMTPDQANQLAQLYNAMFLGGPSMGAVQPGAADDSLAASIVAIGAQVAKLATPTIDPVAVANALADNTAFIAAIASAVVAQVGVDLAAKA
jgi:hypothetical protein